MSTVADQFAEILAMSGVKRIYGVVGDSLNGITGGRAGEVSRSRSHQSLALSQGAVEKIEEK
jgi:pyruvate dehydrogenase (quinone)